MLLAGDGPDGDRLLEDPFNSREECSRPNQFETRISVSLLGAVTDYSNTSSPQERRGGVSVLVTAIIPHSKEIFGCGRGDLDSEPLAALLSAGDPERTSSLPKHSSHYYQVRKSSFIQLVPLIPVSSRPSPNSRQTDRRAVPGTD